MRYLMRDGAPLTEGQWEKIDQAVVTEASKTLVGRRFLDVVNVGAQTQNVPLDKMESAARANLDFWAREDGEVGGTASRSFVQLSTIYADFGISWRDVEDESAAGVQAAREAAILAARREDDLIFYGDAKLGVEGIFNAKGVNHLPLSEWSEGETPVTDVAKAVSMLVDQGFSGDRVLVVSSDLYAQLHRMQPGTGMMEVDRLRNLVGKLLYSSRIEKKSACLVYCEPQNMDLVVGQDMITAYMGNEKLDHVFRVMETVIPRIKRPQSIVVLK